MIGPYSVQPLWAREDLGAMAMKGYSAFLKALLKPRIVSKEDTHGGVLALCRDAVDVFCSSSRLGNVNLGEVFIHAPDVGFHDESKADEWRCSVIVSSHHPRDQDVEWVFDFHQYIYIYINISSN